MDENKDLTNEQADAWLERNMDYVSKCLDEYEESVRNGTAVYYTEEECFTMCDRLIEEWSRSKEPKRCIS